MKEGNWESGKGYRVRCMGVGSWIAELGLGRGLVPGGVRG